MANFKVVYSTHNCLLICRKHLNVFGEYAKRIYAYTEKTQRDSWCIRRKLSISRLIMVQHDNFVWSLRSILDGWIKPKNHFTLLSLWAKFAHKAQIIGKPVQWKRLRFILLIYSVFPRTPFIFSKIIKIAVLYFSYFRSDYAKHSHFGVFPLF